MVGFRSKGPTAVPNTVSQPQLGFNRRSNGLRQRKTERFLIRTDTGPATYLSIFPELSQRISHQPPVAKGDCSSAMGLNGKDSRWKIVVLVMAKVAPVGFCEKLYESVAILFVCKG